MRIWKYPLGLNDRQALTMPPGAKLLTVQAQGEYGACLWALVDERLPDAETRTIAIYGTGTPIPDEPGDYIATFQIMGGELVFHAFEYK